MIVCFFCGPCLLLGKKNRISCHILDRGCLGSFIYLSFSFSLFSSSFSLFFLMFACVMLLGSPYPTCFLFCLVSYIIISCYIGSNHVFVWNIKKALPCKVMRKGRIKMDIHIMKSLLNCLVHRTYIHLYYTHISALYCLPWRCYILACLVVLLRRFCPYLRSDDLTFHSSKWIVPAGFNLFSRLLWPSTRDMLSWRD